MKKVIIAAIVALLITLAVIFWLPSPPQKPGVAFPNPNAYVELAEAGRLVGQPPDDINQAEATVLAEFLDAHRDVLRRIHVALQHESRVPVEYSAEFSSRDLSQTNSVRQAARLLMAEARLAEQQGRMADAAQANLNLIALSQKTAKGGLLVHLLVASAYERFAWNSLLRIAGSMSTEERRQFLSNLESLAYQREALEAYIEREQRLSKAVNGFLLTFINSRQANQVYDQLKQMDEEMKRLKQDVTEAMSEP